MPRPALSPWTRRVAIALTLCLVGCNSGAGNPAGPTTGRQNLPSLANAPQNPDMTPAKRIKVTGKVVDALSGEPLEKVKVLLLTEVTAQPPALPKATPVPPPGGSDSPVLPLPGGSAPGALPAPIQPGALPGTEPPKPEVKVESFTTTTNNEGKFFFNGIPEGTFTVSFAAPKYRVLTMANVDAVKLENVELSGRADLPRKSVKGAVVSAGGQPVVGALVSPVFRAGQGFPSFVPTDDKGQFLLDELTALPRGYTAVSQGQGGQIVAFSLQAPKGDDKKEEKGWLEGLFGAKATPPADKEGPVTLTVKAVTDTVDLSAEVGGEGSAEDYEASEAAVFMTLNDKGDEALVWRGRVKDGAVKLSLPQLPGGGSYHLRVRAVGPDGASSYHHHFKLQGGEKNVAIKFVPAPGEARATLDKETPVFSWAPVVGADGYRVQVDRPNGETVWQGWTTQTSLAYPSAKGFEAINPKEPLMWTVSAVKGITGGKIDPGSLSGEGWSDLGMTAAMELDLSATAKGRRKPEAKPSAKPAAKPSVKPSGKPAPATKPSAAAKTSETVPTPAPSPGPTLEPLEPLEPLDPDAPSDLNPIERI